MQTPPPADLDGSATVPAAVLGSGAREAREVVIPQEEPVTLFLNGQELVTLLASPGERSELAVGFLYDEGIIDRLDQLVSHEADEDGIRVQATGVEMGMRLFERRVLGSGCGKGLGFASALDAFAAAHRALPARVPWVGVQAIQRAALTVYTGGPLYRLTRGTHAAGLFDPDGELVALGEDIGRHNAVDKVIGRLLLAGRPLDDLFMVVTGRISSEMVSKVAKTPIPLLVSKSVATSLAVEHAERLSLGLVGGVARGRLTVYTFPELIDPEA